MSIPSFITNPDPSLYLSDNYFTTDFETTNIAKGTALDDDNHMVLSILRVPGGDYEYYESMIDLTERVSGLVKDGAIMVAHNAKFELQWLSRTGLDLTQVLVYDTLLAEYVLYGNDRSKRLDLGTVAERRGLGGKDPFIDICMKKGVCPSDMPKSLLTKRCIKDVRQTEGIFLQQREELRQKDQLKTLYTRCMFTPVLADIEFNGLCLDGDEVAKTYRDYTRELEEHEYALGELSGGINLGSPKQLGELLYDTLGFSELKDRRGGPLRTPKGGRRTDSTTLAKLKAGNNKQRKFVELYTKYNSVKSALQKNLDFFLGVVEEQGGIFYGQFNQAITQTHRLSASGRSTKFTLFPKAKSVQFQNLPRAFKPMFKARTDGWRVGEIDGAQLEFRVAAHLGRDTEATHSIRTGFDVHTFTANTLTEAGEATDRQGAKAHTFKPLYGGQSGTKAQKAYYQAFREKYQGIAGTQQEWMHTVLAKKELTIPSGLTFFWPNTRLERDYITNTPSICNYPVQSYATADIIPIAVTYMWHRMKESGMKSFLINTIHDSAIGEVHPEETEQYKEIGFQSFTKDVYNYLDNVYDDQFTVPLGAELKLGARWSKGEEFMFTLEPDEVGNEAINNSQRG